VKHDTEEIRRRLTIPQIGAALFPSWRPGKSCKSPFRQDRTPSFSVFKAGRAWKDFASGEGGDVIDFYTKATGLSFKDALGRLAVMAGLHTERERPAKTSKPILPADLHIGSKAELMKLAELRNVSCEAVQLASNAGLLRFGTVCNEPCWILLDKSGKLAQARRRDGKQFDAIGRLPARKAHTLRGSCQSWPLGTLEAANKGFLALVEGMPDLLAAAHFAHAEEAESRVAVIAMLGASNTIPADSLPYFAGKRIRIFAHGDDAGIQAARRWRKQLKGKAQMVEIFSCGAVELTDGEVSNDLNDLTSMTAETFHDDRNLQHLFDFAEEVG